MQPTVEILEKIYQNSSRNKDEIFTRLFRYMLRPDIYYVAYKNLYANSGAGTKGVDSDTADGFSERKVANIIQQLENGTYQPKPVRRTLIDKGNGKKRPLGIPTFTDKLVQEVLRMILESVFEPIFSRHSHGFRPKRSCHTALTEIKKEFSVSRWFIEGDIKGCFDNIDHSVLVSVIGRKVKDARLIQLIWKFLKAGYMEDWKYNKTFSGTPQGGIISPILANIYLNELDNFMEKLSEEFYKPAERKRTKEYDSARGKVDYIRKKLKKAGDEKKKELLQELHEARKIMMSLPAKSQTNKGIKYIRYADDFLIGVCGDKQDCVQIKQKISDFITNTLKMTLSEEKTLITHSNTHARFLGYDVRVRRSNLIKRGNNHTKRTLNNTIELNIPLKDKIEAFLFRKNTVFQNTLGELIPCKRKGMLYLTDLEILTAYNSELRGICNYYSMASNFSTLSYFAYLMEYSCLKTIAAKHKTQITKIIHKYAARSDKGKWGIPYQTKKGMCRSYFAKFMECKETKFCKDEIPTMTELFLGSRSSFESRLKAKECELCGTTESENYDIHHVNKVKNLKGKAHWEVIMIARRRKTMVVCEDCHKEIHRPK